MEAAIAKLMKLDDTFFQYRNPETTKDLIIPIGMAGTVTIEETKANVRANLPLDVPWLDESPAHDGVAIICGAGPSLGDTVEQVRQQQEAGGKIFASNSACAYLISQWMAVDYQSILDPHPSMADDMAEAGCHLIASFADPSLFKISRNPVLWHPLTDWIEDLIPEGRSNFTFIGGGITVTNSSLCLAYTMGYREFHVHGMDSSHREGRRHVADCTELDGLAVVVEENGKTYATTYDMKQQVVVFREIRKQLINAGCVVKVYGSGLLPDMFKAN
jgi:hypothetical protein